MRASLHLFGNLRCPEFATMPNGVDNSVRFPCNGVDSALIDLVSDVEDLQADVTYLYANVAYVNQDYLNTANISDGCVDIIHLNPACGGLAGIGCF